jgi:diguanylate cyclase (GGDEF)-like protein
MSSHDSPPTILVVDDTQNNVTILERLLTSEGYQVISAYRGNTALNLAEKHHPDLILLDIGMPIMDGHEVCSRLKASEKTNDIPVIFISAFSDTEEIVKALSVGGVDYVTKPFQIEEVLARIAIHIQIRYLQKLLEEKNTILEAEIQRRKKVENQLKILAATDPLTKIYNRRQFFELAMNEYSRSRRSGKPLSIIMIDIDHFKKVNDTYGHLVGDQVLIYFAQLLKKCIRAYDLLGRYGGEEFVVMLPETNNQLAVMIAERLRTFTEKTVLPVKSHKISITASFGVSSNNKDSELPLEAILHRADQALYKSKQDGRNKVSFWR